MINICRELQTYRFEKDLKTSRYKKNTVIIMKNSVGMLNDGLNGTK